MRWFLLGLPDSLTTHLLEQDFIGKSGLAELILAERKAEIHLKSSIGFENKLPITKTTTLPWPLSLNSAF